MRRMIKMMILSVVSISFLALCDVQAQINTTAPRVNVADMMRARSGSLSVTSVDFSKILNPQRLREGKPRVLKVGEDGTLLYGTVIYSNAWNGNNKYGIYSFPALNNTSLTEIFQDNSMCKATANAIYHNGRYSVLTANDDGTGQISGISYYELDAEDWSETNENELSANYYAADMAVNPLDNKIYGAFANYEGGMELAVVDFDNFTRKAIGKLQVSMAAIAIDTEGTIYGIGQNGILYTINSNDATLKEVGSTGIKPSYLQSATIDLATNKMYWTTTTTGDIAGLYEVNLTTAKATLISTFANGEEVVGLYTLSKLSADDAPAAVTNVKTIFEGASVSGTLTFSLPTSTNKGEDLDGVINYSVSVNGVEAAQGSGEAGQTITIPVTTVAGSNKIVISLTNDAGKGTPYSVVVWTGYDIPLAPENITISQENENINLSWDAPKEGLHHGVIDLATLRYDVVRYPDSTVIARKINETKCTDKITSSYLTAYYYEITAYADTLAGGTAISKTFVSGNAVALPYMQQFDDEKQFNLLTALDGDGDGESWTFSKASSSALLGGAPFESTDDWIVLPKFKFTADRYYKIAYRTQCQWAGNYPYNTAAYYGEAPDIESLSKQIIAYKSIKTPESHDHSGFFSVAHDGDYYVGLQVNGYDIQNVQLDSICIEEGPLFTAPDTVSDIVAKADEKGLAKVELSFKAPSKDLSGNALKTISKIVILRNGALLTTLNEVSPGEHLVYTDEHAINQAMNTYTVVVYNDSGAGLDVTRSTYVGYDIPTAPDHVRLEVVNSTHARLTWNAPLKGVNGGFIDTDNLTYGVVRSDNQIVASSTVEHSINDTISQIGEQRYVAYGVLAHNKLGYGATGLSNTVIAGAPYTLPFHETFANGTLTNFWGSEKYNDQGWGASWSPSSDDDADGNHGFIAFGQSGGREGSGAKLFSGKVNIRGAKNLVLEFSYSHRSEPSEIGIRHDLKVGVIKNGSDTTYIKELSPIYFYELNLQHPFNFVRVPLSQYSDADFIQVVFDAINDGTTYSYIDDVTLRDYLPYDLQVDVNAPVSATAGDSILVKSVVKNIGSKQADHYSVELYDAYGLVDTKDGMDILADSTVDYQFKVAVGTLSKEQRYVVKIVYDKDEQPGNNVSDTAKVAVNLPAYPVPTAARGTYDKNNLNLVWTAPDYQSYAGVTVQTMENMSSFAIDNLDDWTVVDVDKKNTRNDIQIDGTNITYPHQGESFAWIVVNPEEANIPTESWWGGNNGWQAASGKQYLASITSVDGVNDDWLISPELSGDAQQISFAQHGYYGMEKYEVLYSTTDTELSHFISLGEQSSAAEWTTVSFSLPEGSRYFAIRHLGGESSQGLFVDDISYSSKSDKGVLALAGYNLYCDGKKIAAVSPEKQSCQVEKLSTDSHQYQITAVYNLGESAATSFLLDSSTGIGHDSINPSAVSSYFGLDGKRQSAARSGVNIIRFTNGKSIKILKK